MKEKKKISTGNMELAKKVASFGYYPMIPNIMFPFLKNSNKEERILKESYISKLFTLCDEIWQENKQGEEKHLKVVKGYLPTFLIGDLAFLCHSSSNEEEYGRYLVSLGYCPIIPSLMYPALEQTEEARLSYDLAWLDDCSVLFVLGEVTKKMEQEISYAFEHNISVFFLNKK